MTDDNEIANDNPVEGDVKFYHFAYMFKNEGFLASRLSEQETRDKLNRELADIYGPDGLTVSEFRLATSEEIESQQEMIDRFNEVAKPVLN